MPLRKHAETAVDAVFTALAAHPTPELRKQVTDIIEATIVEAVRENCKQSSNAAANVCEADQDLAHKIAGGIERAQQALIANLQGLR